MKQTRTKKRTWSLLLAASVVLGGIGSLHLCGFLDGPFNDRAFDAALLKQCHSSGCGLKNPRGQMVEDLTKQWLLPTGQPRPTRAEVIALLGPPDAQLEPRDGEPTDTSLSYSIGTWSSLMEMDPDVLIISFDQADRVENASVQRT